MLQTLLAVLPVSGWPLRPRAWPARHAYGAVLALSLTIETAILYTHVTEMGDTLLASAILVFYSLLRLVAAVAAARHRADLCLVSE